MLVPLEKTPIAELEFLGLPIRIINIVEQGMQTIWLEDLPEDLKSSLLAVDQIGPYWVSRIVRAVEKWKQSREKNNGNGM